ELPFTPLPSFHPLALDPARQFLLAPQLNHGVLLGDFRIRVASDLGSLDAAAAYLLPPCDVGPAKRMWPEAGEIATFGGCGELERLADARVPHGLPLVVVLWKNPRIGILML